jgi:hypothetical protein
MATLPTQPDGPRVVIVLGFEAKPCVYIDAANDAAERRLRDWLKARGYWSRLIELALELNEELPECGQPS